MFDCPSCGKTTRYIDLPQPRVYFVGQDFEGEPPRRNYIICRCGEKAYAWTGKENVMGRETHHPLSKQHCARLEEEFPFLDFMAESCEKTIKQNLKDKSPESVRANIRAYMELVASKIILDTLTASPEWCSPPEAQED